MESFSALLALGAGNSPDRWIPPHKGQWREALMFSLICAWINGWVNNRGAGDFRRHRPHYDVIVIGWQYKGPNISNHGVDLVLAEWPHQQTKIQIIISPADVSLHSCRDGRNRWTWKKMITVKTIDVSLMRPDLSNHCWNITWRPH